MWSMIVGWILTPLGKIFAGVLGVLGLWLWGRHQKAKAEKAEARAVAAETKVEIQKVEAEYAPKIDRVEEAGRSGDAAAVADSINRLWGDKTKSE